MKINVIVSNPPSENVSTMDANIILFLFKKLRYNIEPKIIEADNYKCDNASINIFIGVINPLFIQYAKTNIFLFNINTFPKTQSSNLRLMDYIFTKTEFEKEILKLSISKEKIINIGWRTTDFYKSQSDIDYRKYMLFCNSEINDKSEYKKILDSWLNSQAKIDGKLHVINFELTKLNKSMFNHPSIIFENNITQNKFETLFNTCGIKLCLSNFNGYSHYLNQSILCKSIPVISDIETHKTLTNCEHFNFAYTVDVTEQKNKVLYGKKNLISQSSLESTLNNLAKLPIDQLEEFGVQARSNALKNQAQNDVVFKEHMMNIIKNTHSKSKLEDIKEPTDGSEWPTVSVVTLTHNRKKFFNLATLNYNNIDYPKNKLEWVIYDTSNQNNCVEDMLPAKNVRENKYNIKYVYDSTIETIGVSRNKALSLCSHEIIVFMDDDDYYPESSIKNRIIPFINDPQINIVGCRFLGSFEINKFISYIDSPQLFSSYTKFIKIASLAFKKELLIKFNPFCNDSSINELNSVISSTTSSFKELSWEGVIVSLIHTKNTTHRLVPNSDSNGCHFGFGNKMFQFITELDKTDEELLEQQEKLERAKKELEAKQPEN